MLIFGYGNPGRGDDALGPELIGRIAKLRLAHVECQNDMQLQVEHVTDLAECGQVLFIDADISCAEPFDFSEIGAVKDDSYTSHAMTPTALLYAYRQVYRKQAPPAFLLRIRGYDFELGEKLTEKASTNLDEAMKLVTQLCTTSGCQSGGAIW
ncbi:hydrogenase maturation protease [Ferrovum myxofaciens]|uniref:Hydrogenase maturation protease n=2 Tax=root TaxID=1 RepID=A0A9E6MXN1_9PROT|nr:hydrogenase maturation protease [Ferrovum myxofaciens]QKE37839.2 MAG: hydrogenase maturation protease [Ferrovum myxofaciens]QWY78253.1 MAG: hydrogenase maturation protease [Ferrovum myxofaciens]